jgi:hypothetical protein
MRFGNNHTSSWPVAVHHPQDKEADFRSPNLPRPWGTHTRRPESTSPSHALRRQDQRPNRSDGGDLVRRL